ncbi:protein phosphatase 2C domain-containing protein [Polyangium aurulentum]|uniref:protein phosphatase 2C domain-containing protein n=1 Tax=Polyangium aurulentum TaxID=2567896 RepID=UPI0010AE5697|nr:protein phosphatase 2C domain-containing protein [Polyangium aurulentum]UQA59641.1 protein phosphatase 2C domain-containing protein [Polyangium aurulentum]
MDRVDKEFEIAAGSVPGRSHVLAGRGNQDAFAFRAGKDGLFAVVCDGCGSSAHSEVGAAIGARVVLEAGMAAIARGAAVDDEATWETVRRESLASLGATARAMGGRLEEVVGEYLLFTVIGVAVARGRATIVGIGDGFFASPGERVRIGPFAGNAPPYLGYGLLDEGPRFTMHRAFDAAALDAVLVGTDGAADMDELEGSALPGSDERLGAISQFWTEDKYFRNRDAIRRALSLVNREVQRPVWSERRVHREAGLLDDDTTVLVIRRRPS